MLIASLLALLASSAHATPLDDFVEDVGAPVLAVLQCRPATALHQWMDAQQDMGGFVIVDQVGRATLGAVYDDQAPVYAAIAVTEADPRALVLEFGVTDAEAAAPKLDASARDGALATEGVSYHQRGDRVLVQITKESDLDLPIPEARGTALVRRVEALEVADACGLSANLDALLKTPSGQSLISVPFDAHALDMVFARPDDVIHAKLEIEPPSGPVLDVLDGLGEPGLLEVHANQGFPLVIQVHADLREALSALSSLSPGRQALFLSVLAGTIPPQIRTAPGLVVATGGLEEGGLFVIPMERPKGARRLFRMTRYVADKAGATFEKVGHNRATISLEGKPPLTIGTRRGLVAVALHPEVVDDVLAGRGPALLPPVEAPYGIRAAAEPGRFAQIAGLGGVIEARYVDGTLQLTGWPLPAREEAQ